MLLVYSPMCMVLSRNSDFDIDEESQPVAWNWNRNIPKKQWYAMFPVMNTEDLSKLQQRRRRRDP